MILCDQYTTSTVCGASFFFWDLYARALTRHPSSSICTVNIEYCYIQHLNKIQIVNITILSFNKSDIKQPKNR